MTEQAKTGQRYKTTQFEKLGGLDGVRRLVGYFYETMKTAPEAETIRKMHEATMETAEEKLYLFLCGWLGGPALYVERHGSPRLRARHLPFSIGSKERDEWLFCMNKALSKMEIPQDMHDELMQAFYNTADFMRNKQEH